MKEFKIIAIRPTEYCRKPQHLKILSRQELYQFYSGYKIDVDADTITRIDKLPDAFFTQKQPPVSVSAIVGKNGSGKSTIIELLFKAINNIAYLSPRITTDLKFVQGLNVDLYFDTGTLYKISLKHKEMKVFKYARNGHAHEILSPGTLFSELFYTIAVNYSHYAYNSSEFGDESAWIDSLFHKNDGYQTPLVINPMRTDGDVYINSENHLVRSRLIAAIISDDKGGFDFTRFAEDYKVLHLILTPRKSIRTKTIYEIPNQDAKPSEKVSLKSLSLDEAKILRELNRRYPFNLGKLDKQKHEVALDYILYKLVSISLKYADYKQYFDRSSKSFLPGVIEKYLDELMTDPSHITFKLRQTLNYLKFEHINPDEEIIDMTVMSEEISKRIKSNRQKNRLRVIDLIPPPIFKVDIILQNKLYPDEKINFETLSSGQKQMIYSVSSLLYHLTNLDSIKRTSSKRVSYKYVNIVLEEIELYFHPEMQRAYVKTILTGIEALKLETIRGINICFVTHSPFILSDIPNCNILFLGKNGKPDPKAAETKTFGGNIHSLLSHSFFLENGLIGSFAKEKIEDCIQQLNELNPTQDPGQINEIKSIISLIGEPFVRDKLFDMFYAAFSDRINRRKEISILKNRIKELEK